MYEQELLLLDLSRPSLAFILGRCGLFLFHSDGHVFVIGVLLYATNLLQSRFLSGGQNIFVSQLFLLFQLFDLLLKLLNLRGILSSDSVDLILLFRGQPQLFVVGWQRCSHDDRFWLVIPHKETTPDHAHDKQRSDTPQARHWIPPRIKEGQEISSTDPEIKSIVGFECRFKKNQG